MDSAFDAKLPIVESALVVSAAILIGALMDEYRSSIVDFTEFIAKSSILRASDDLLPSLINDVICSTTFLQNQLH